MIAEHEGAFEAARNGLHALSEIRADGGVKERRLGEARSGAGPMQADDARGK